MTTVISGSVLCSGVFEEKLVYPFSLGKCLPSGDEPSRPRFYTSVARRKYQQSRQCNRDFSSSDCVHARFISILHSPQTVP